MYRRVAKLPHFRLSILLLGSGVEHCVVSTHLEIDRTGETKEQRQIVECRRCARVSLPAFDVSEICQFSLLALWNCAKRFRRFSSCRFVWPPMHSVMSGLANGPIRTKRR